MDVQIEDNEEDATVSPGPSGGDAEDEPSDVSNVT